MTNDPRSEHAEDPELAAAGERLRADTTGLSPDRVRAAALGRRTRQLGVLAGVSLLAVVLLGGALVVAVVRGGGDSDRPPYLRAGGPEASEVEAILADLPAEPVDPTEVKLLRTVSTFGSCDALVSDLRRVGAAHVGSRGFGGGYWGPFQPWAAEGYDGAARDEATTTADMALPRSDSPAEAAASGEMGGGEAIGTNVQVAGVDEPDHVKADGTHIYDLGPGGVLRITDGRSGEVTGSVDVTPGERSQVDSLLVADGRTVVFGSEFEISDAIEGDPSATQLTTSWLTVALVDVNDPTDPKLTQRVRIDGSLVSARLVNGEIRLVTTSQLADIGMVVPMTPNAVGTALDANRRAVASSLVTDWIPNWQTGDGDRQPLVPCERVHVPDTFAGVAMTSMVTFPLDSDSFEPTGTGLLAPADDLYAGVDRVAVSAGVWVDPIDRDELEFDDWRTAVHEFTFTDDGAPAYEGSGIIDGSTIGQFSFGEIGNDLGVVSASGTPWGLDRNGTVDLTVLRRAGDGELQAASTIDDLAGGRGSVSAVRFLTDRILVSTGVRDRDLAVIDVSDPAAPRRAGSVEIADEVGYFHPLEDGRALVFGSRWETVGSGVDQEEQPWVRVDLIDVSDADAPVVLDSWERAWSSDELGWDHHALTWWPTRKLALWGLTAQRWTEPEQPNHAAVIGADSELTETAVVEASRPPEQPAPCAEVPVPADARDLLGDDAKVLRCDDRAVAEVEWPGWDCWSIEDGMVEEFSPGASGEGRHFSCSPAGPPSVSRVLIVDGIPILYTDQTLEILDPDTFASEKVIARSTENGFTMW